MSSESRVLAQKEINRRRQDAEFGANVRQMEIFDKSEAAKQISLQLANTSAELSEAIFSGNKNEDSQADIKAKIDKIMRINLERQANLKQILKELGYPEDYLDIKYTCSVCDDSGYVNGERCECLKKLIARFNIERFNSENKIAQSGSFDTFLLKYYSDKAENGRSDREIMSEILNNCRQYAELFTPNAKSILMIGGTGLGKTHLSMAIAEQVMKNGYTAMYSSAPDLFRRLQNEYYGRGENGADTMSSIKKADLFIIDDLGAEIENQFASSSLYNIINLRLNNQSPTIISTNLSFKEIERRYGDRVASRLVTLYRCLMFAGKDIRLIKLKNNEL